MASNFCVLLKYHSRTADDTTFTVWRHPRVIFPNGKFGGMAFSGKWNFFFEAKRLNTVITTQSHPDFDAQLSWLLENQKFFKPEEILEFVNSHDRTTFFEPPAPDQFDGTPENWMGLSYEEIDETEEARKGWAAGYAGDESTSLYVNLARAWLWQSGYCNGVGDRLQEESFYDYLDEALAKSK